VEAFSFYFRDCKASASCQGVPGNGSWHCCHSGNQQQGRAFTPASRFARVVLSTWKSPFQCRNLFRRVYEEECPYPPLSCHCPRSCHCRPFRLRRSRSAVRVAHHGHHDDPASLFNSGRGKQRECGPPQSSNDTAGAGVSWSCHPEFCLRFVQSGFHNERCKHNVYRRPSAGAWRRTKLPSWLPP